MLAYVALEWLQRRGLSGKGRVQRGRFSGEMSGTLRPNRSLYRHCCFCQTSPDTPASCVLQSITALTRRQPHTYAILSNGTTACAMHTHISFRGVGEAWITGGRRAADHAGGRKGMDGVWSMKAVRFLSRYVSHREAYFAERGGRGSVGRQNMTGEEDEKRGKGRERVRRCTVGTRPTGRPAYVDAVGNGGPQLPRRRRYKGATKTAHA